MGFSAAVVGAFGPMLSPGFVQVAHELDISINTLSQATAWLILTLGLSLFFVSPIAKTFGRRPIYIVAIAIMFATSVWGAFSKNYSSFLASRIVSGFGMAPYEVLVQNTVGDLYFVHQRATRIAVWNLFLLCGITGGSLVSGYIIEVSRIEVSKRDLTDKREGHRVEMDLRNLCHLLWGFHFSCHILGPGNRLCSTTTSREVYGSPCSNIRRRETRTRCRLQRRRSSITTKAIPSSLSVWRIERAILENTSIFNWEEIQ